MIKFKYFSIFLAMDFIAYVTTNFVTEDEFFQTLGFLAFVSILGLLRTVVLGAVFSCVSLALSSVGLSKIKVFVLSGLSTFLFLITLFAQRLFQEGFIENYILLFESSNQFLLNIFPFIFSYFVSLFCIRLFKWDK